MANIPGLGTAIATDDSPTPLNFSFVISEETARTYIESGTFVQVHLDDELVIGVVQSLRRTNRYFSSPDIIHGSNQGISMQSVYPAERWDYIIAQVKVLGAYRDNLKIRSTRPIIPGSKVEVVDEQILRKFLGLDPKGLKIGQIRQSGLDADINLDKLLQKHLAILSISGGGKSYATSVVIEEIMRRDRFSGRPALVMFDVHGEYSDLLSLKDSPHFNDIQIEHIPASKIKLGLGHMKVGDFGKMFPTMSYAQKRELGQILGYLRGRDEPITIDSIINMIFNYEMNALVKEALLGWMSQLKSTYLFSNQETPNLEERIKPGKLVIFDLSDITSLWTKQIILNYFLTRLFELRRKRAISPVITFVEEAHQFAPEQESSAAKSMIHTIAREGRKFLCALVLISQRPVNLSTTALSQCNSHLILRILNPHDLAYIGKTSEGISKETLAMLTSLGVGEGLLVGEAVNYPVFVQVRRKLAKAMFDEASMSLESQKFERISSVEEIQNS